MSTTIPHESDAERIEDEAAVWAARLRGGGMTDIDRERLTTWLAANPEHGWVLSRYRELTSQLDVGLDPANAAELRTATGRRRWRVAATGLAAAAAITLAWIGFAGRGSELITKTAERHVASLADGSHVELNAQTELKVNFSARERHVRLAYGEALFTVAKDPTRPFVVETPAGVVRVTGTIFNVRAAQAERVEVTVLEGHVRVRPAKISEDTALTPGRQVAIVGENVALRALDEAAMQDVIAWRSGLAVFTDTPLRDVLDRFAAYHSRTITVAPEVADLRLGGRYSLDDLESALESIERTLPVRVERGAAGAVKIVAAGAR